jgi:ParB-like chromosome segregation protein Spo0J
MDLKKHFLTLVSKSDNSNLINLNILKFKNQKNILELENSILKNGMLHPIVIRKIDNVVIAGNQRCTFAKKYGYKKISYVYAKPWANAILTE